MRTIAAMTCSVYAFGIALLGIGCSGRTTSGASEAPSDSAMEVQTSGVGVRSSALDAGTEPPASPPPRRRTCGDVQCRPGSICQMVHTSCLRPPCPPSAECVPEARPPR